jgi:hypothetical protein
VEFAGVVLLFSSIEPIPISTTNENGYSLAIELIISDTE